MEIKEHRLLLFIEIYRELHGITLSRSEAHEKASFMLRYALLCIKPLAKVEDHTIIDMPD